ncbi:MAG: sulfatase-like hydrolase/transferase, partial [Bacteroidia bacterium]|nr:sulfatase-like hydrolase/transferase [Bacteroidia bacterium]
IAINSDKAIDTPISLLAEGMFRGLVFDLSLWGYISLFAIVLVLIFGLFTSIGLPLRITNALTGILSTIIVILLPGDAIIYSYWGRHYDFSDLGMIIDNPSLALASVETPMLVLYIIVAVIFAICNIIVLKKFTCKVTEEKNDVAPKYWQRGVQFLAIAVIGGLLVIPIRGGVGLAPLNTGRAYFSNTLFANHVALNPVWNFIYSIKRANQTSQTYHFMSDEEANKIFSKLTSGAHSDNFLPILKNNRPNVVYILLESFSAHCIEALGGENVTPNLMKIAKEGIFFDNIYASSDRSGKGLVAAMCGYPVLPTYSIIQYPQKTQALPYMAKKMRENGYESQTFIYGGDLRFNSFNSLVTLAGFDNVITENDFPSSAMGDKWGAHDESTLSRLLEEMKSQKQPFFDFIFTLSSHEPFTVPMEKHHDNPYLNSVFYTDSCLGDFFCRAKNSGLWDNTLYVLVADHGHGGPNNVGNDDKMRFRIPFVLTGGALCVSDTTINKVGSQIDIVSTVLPQLGIDAQEFKFSKNLLSEDAASYAFYDFNDGFGYVDNDQYYVYDNQGAQFLKYESNKNNDQDSSIGMAILQTMSDDCANLDKKGR